MGIDPMNLPMPGDSSSQKATVREVLKACNNQKQHQSNPITCHYRKRAAQRGGRLRHPLPLRLNTGAHKTVSAQGRYRHSEKGMRETGSRGPASKRGGGGAACARTCARLLERAASQAKTRAASGCLPRQPEIKKKDRSPGKPSPWGLPARAVPPLPAAERRAPAAQQPRTAGFSWKADPTYFPQAPPCRMASDRRSLAGPGSRGQTQAHPGQH